MIQHWIEVSILVMGVHLVITELLYTFIDDPENIYLSLNKWQQYLSKPTWYCPTCMASVWGTFWHFYLGGFYNDIMLWPITLIAVACINTIIAKWVR